MGAQSAKVLSLAHVRFWVAAVITAMTETGAQSRRSDRSQCHDRLLAKFSSSAAKAKGAGRYTYAAFAFPPVTNAAQSFISLARFAR